MCNTVSDSEQGSDVLQESGGRALETRKGLLDDYPNGLPALMMCREICCKAVAAGFDWGSANEVWDQLYSEIAEFQEAPADSAQAEMEFGDILFTLVNIARWCHIDAQSALRASCAKFCARWSSMEQDAWAQGYNLEDLPRDKQEALWKQAKQKEKRS